jgi:S-adenosylmethionine:tRNA-ribosyltransferase-isomerase (queuine synthetase)
VLLVPSEHHSRRITDRRVEHLPELLRAGDLLVLNAGAGVTDLLLGHGFGDSCLILDS